MQGIFLQERSGHADAPRAVRSVPVGGIAPPFAAYSHAVEVAGGARLLFCSGQLGQDPDGHVPEGCEAQAELCFRNIAAILASAGMDLSDVVRINAFVTAREHMAAYMRVRDRLFAAGLPPASTLMIVGGFTREEFLVEVEVVAAAHPPTPAGTGEGA